MDINLKYKTKNIQYEIILTAGDTVSMDLKYKRKKKYLIWVLFNTHDAVDIYLEYKTKKFN